MAPEGVVEGEAHDVAETAEVAPSLEAFLSQLHEARRFNTKHRTTPSNGEHRGKDVEIGHALWRDCTMTD
eukprot:1497974-Amphidinium_carterae.1